MVRQGPQNPHQTYRLRERGLDVTPAAQAPPLRGSA